MDEEEMTHVIHVGTYPTHLAFFSLWRFIPLSLGKSHSLALTNSYQLLGIWKVEDILILQRRISQEIANIHLFKFDIG